MSSLRVKNEYVDFFIKQEHIQHIVREKSSKNEMDPLKNKPERFLHFWNPQDL